MKNYKIILIAALVVGIASCKNRQKIAKAEEQMNSLSTENEDSTFVNDAFSDLEDDFDVVEVSDTNEIKQDKSDVTYAVLERGACFGRCPIYKVKIFADGKATYEGINFVDLMGRHETEFTADELSLIEEKAFEFKLDTMSKVYDQPMVTDLPTTIIGVTVNGKYKQIKMRHKYPETLRSYRNFIEELIQSKTWTPIVSNRE